MIFGRKVIYERVSRDGEAATTVRMEFSGYSAARAIDAIRQIDAMAEAAGSFRGVAAMYRRTKTPP